MRLRQSPPEGIQVVFNEDNVLDIQAVLHGPMGTPYEKGQFRIRLVLGSDFPQQPPKGQFLTTIFHPNVSSQGEICVSTLKKDWKPDVGIEQLLLVIKCLLIVPNPESALNEEAGKLLLEDYDAYFNRARLMTQIHAIKDAENENATSPQKRTSEAKPKQDKKKTLRRL